MRALMLVLQLTTTRPTPEQAIAVLQKSHLESDMTGKRLASWPDRPKVIYIEGSTKSGPFGSFPVYTPSVTYSTFYRINNPTSSRRTK